MFWGTIEAKMVGGVHVVGCRGSSVAGTLSPQSRAIVRIKGASMSN